MLDVLFTLLDAVRKYQTQGERVHAGSSPLWRGRLGGRRLRWLFTLYRVRRHEWGGSDVCSATTTSMLLQVTLNSSGGETSLEELCHLGVAFRVISGLGGGFLLALCFLFPNVRHPSPMLLPLPW